MTELLYSNAPLREVIAEVKWELDPLQTAQGHIDPFYRPLLRNLTASLDAEGFNVVETRIPDEVPREFISYQAAKLFRRESIAWPAFQLGPGVFTTNVVPPYGGWTDFRLFIAKGLRSLVAAHPVPTELRINDIQLQYINVFDDTHGAGDDPVAFLKKILRLGAELPPSMQEVGEELAQAGEAVVRLERASATIGTIRWRIVANSDAVERKGVLLELILRSNEHKFPAEQAANAILDELDDLHNIVSQWFGSFITPELLPLLGEPNKL